jgi:hypothetical protein
VVKGRGAVVLASDGDRSSGIMKLVAGGTLYQLFAIGEEGKGKDGGERETNHRLQYRTSGNSTLRS